MNNLSHPKLISEVNVVKTTAVRLPTIDSALKKLLSAGIQISNVIDIGVLTGTGFLVEFFPKAKHYLFEPVDSFFGQIRAGYREVDYELHQLAVSSSSGTAFQVGVSADNSRNVTHSYVSESQVLVGESTPQGVVIECKVIKKIALDDFFYEASLPSGYLIKIDVDGHEMPIIQGAQDSLKNADIVIIEAPVHSLLERANAMVKLGFELVEIVDICYYHQLLSQVDLIFINKKIISQHADLRPWATKEFSFHQWHAFNP